MESGSIVLTPLPQADGQIKNRPALVLARMPPYDDLLVCGISSQIRLAVEDFDELLRPGEQDFKRSGLVATSVIRLGFLSTVPLGAVKGAIGVIAVPRFRRLTKRLANYLIETSESLSG